MRLLAGSTDRLPPEEISFDLVRDSCPIVLGVGRIVFWRAHELPSNLTPDAALELFPPGSYAQRRLAGRIHTDDGGFGYDAYGSAWNGADGIEGTDGVGQGPNEGPGYGVCWADEADDKSLGEGEGHGAGAYGYSYYEPEGFDWRSGAPRAAFHSGNGAGDLRWAYGRCFGTIIDQGDPGRVDVGGGESVKLYGNTGLSDYYAGFKLEAV